MLNIAICDDNGAVVHDVRKMLDGVLVQCGQAGNIREYTNPSSFKFDILEYMPLDLCILDVEMPDISGMELAKEIKAKFPECYIIFLTEHTKYAIDAYELNIFRYTEKSKMQEKLPQYITDALRLISLQNGLVYTVVNGERTERLPYSQMQTVQKDGKYSVITCLDDREIRIRKPLADVYAELDKNEFLQIDRGCIVNISMISQITSDFIVCKNGLHLQYSRTKTKEIKSKVLLYWGKII